MKFFKLPTHPVLKNATALLCKLKTSFHHRLALNKSLLGIIILSLLYIITACGTSEKPGDVTKKFFDIMFTTGNFDELKSFSVEGVTFFSGFTEEEVSNIFKVRFPTLGKSCGYEGVKILNEEIEQEEAEVSFTVLVSSQEGKCQDLGRSYRMSLTKNDGKWLVAGMPK